MRPTFTIYNEPLTDLRPRALAERVRAMLNTGPEPNTEDGTRLLATVGLLIAQRLSALDTSGDRVAEAVDGLRLNLVPVLEPVTELVTMALADEREFKATKAQVSDAATLPLDALVHVAITTWPDGRETCAVFADSSAFADHVTAMNARLGRVRDFTDRVRVPTPVVDPTGEGRF